MSDETLAVKIQYLVTEYDERATNYRQQAAGMVEGTANVYITLGAAIILEVVAAQLKELIQAQLECSTEAPCPNLNK